MYELSIVIDNKRRNALIDCDKSMLERSLSSAMTRLLGTHYVSYTDWLILNDIERRVVWDTVVYWEQNGDWQETMATISVTYVDAYDVHIVA